MVGTCGVSVLINITPVHFSVANLKKKKQANIVENLLAVKLRYIFFVVVLSSAIFCVKTTKPRIDFPPIQTPWHPTAFLARKRRATNNNDTSCRNQYETATHVAVTKNYHI